MPANSTSHVRLVLRVTIVAVLLMCVLSVLRFGEPALAGQPFEAPFAMPSGPALSASGAYTLYLPLIAHGPGGSPPPPLPVISSFSGTPGTVTLGCASTLNWSVSNASSLSLSSVGPVAGTHTSVSPIETQTYKLTATNAAGSASAQTTVNVISTVPADPATLAPALNAGVVSGLAAATSFLYGGVNPVQTCAQAGAIQQNRVAVLRGKVLTRVGAPLVGAIIGVLGHPEFGKTLSRADGLFDLAVNGGGFLTVTYDKSGFLPAQRQVSAAWNSYVALPDVALVALDSNVTPVTLNGGGSMQVVRGSVMSDADGSRQSTLLIPQGVTATMLLPGGVRQPLTQLHVHVTEYTVGASGQAAMPAGLPATSGYTYAEDFSVDEALAAGAETTLFSQPLIHYVENFLNYPVGSHIPLGAYDPSKAMWIPSDDGRVVKVLSISAGMANLDVDGSGLPAGASALAALGIGDAERQTLASLYTAGQSLWRALIPHFSWPWDLNTGFACPDVNGNSKFDDCPPPNQSPPQQDLDQVCKVSGSIIGCENQSLGEAVDVVGTPFQLHYQSERTLGRTAGYSLDIPLSVGVTLMTHTKRIDLQVLVGGRLFAQTFPTTTDQVATFTWDGKDAFGRTPQGRQAVTVRIGYTYPVVRMSRADAVQTFAVYGDTPLSGSKARMELTVWQESHGSIGTWDERGNGLGGWSLDVHHVYDPFSGALYLGDGSKRTGGSLPPVLYTVAGGGNCGNEACGDGGPVTQAEVNSAALMIGPDGSMYITSPDGSSNTTLDVIRKVDANGIITRIAGGGNPADELGDGLPATQARLVDAVHTALAPDGTLYIADAGHSRIRKVDASGIITTVAGTGVIGFTGDGGLATSAKLNRAEGVAVSADGTLYIADTVNGRVRRISATGIITTVAGNGVPNFCGDGLLATKACMQLPRDIAFGPDGSLYIATGQNQRVRRLATDGTISTFAGTGVSGYFGDGGPATLAKLNGPNTLAVAPDGTVYIIESILTPRVRRVSPDGVITTFAGTGIRCAVNPGTCNEGGAAAQTRLKDPRGIAVVSDDRICIGESDRIRCVRGALQGENAGDYTIASEDGGEVYVFNNEGRHLRTLDALTGALRYQFNYDGANRLISIVDGDGDTTVIQRDGSGNPTAIVGPFGQHTGLTLNGNGYLQSISNPAGETIQLGYTNGGLLTSLVDARNLTHTFQYDVYGRLTHDDNPAAGFSALARVDRKQVYTVTLTTALSRTLQYRVETPNADTQKRINTLPDGLQMQFSKTNSSGQEFWRTEDGTTQGQTLGGDPRFGMLAPIGTQMTLTTPGALAYGSQVTRTATLTNSADPLSLSALSEIVTINGRAFLNLYNATTRTRTATTPEGRQRSITLDARGRPIGSLIAGLLPLGYSYDGHGRVISSTIGAGATAWTVDLTYNPSGYVQAIGDALGHAASFTYDAAGRLNGQTAPGGGLTTFGYDANGNLTSLTPPGKPAHSFSYTALDLMASYTPPSLGAGSTQTQYTYNADQFLTRVSRPDGKALDYGYDNAGRLQGITLKRGTLAFSYNGTTGNLAAINAPGGLGLTFDFDGQLLRREAWTGAVSGIITRTYDNNFRTTALALNGDAVTLGYDNDDLLTQAGALALSYDALNGSLTGSTLAGVSDSLGYDGFGEPLSYTATYNGAPLFMQAFGYDKLGRIVTKTESFAGAPDVYVYTYDAAERLGAVGKNGAALAAYTYDANGNRLTRTGGGTLSGTYDAQDRLTLYGTAAYSYTANGELLSKTVGAQVTSYDYDELGNLVHVSLPDGTLLDYLVDGQSRRVGKKVNGTLVQGFLYQGQLRPLAELDGSNNVVSRFVYATRSNLPDYMVKGGVTYRIVADQLGSPRLVVNSATGQVVQRMDFDEFGVVLLDTNPGFQPFGFAGGLYDRDTGLVHFGARDYDAAIGRWLAKDPMLFAGGQTNLYAYLDDDPVNRTDPSGLDAEAENWSHDLNNAKHWVQDHAKDLIDKGIKAAGGKGICVAGGCIAKEGKPQLSLGGDAKLEIGGKEVASAGAECTVGITTEGTASDPLFTAKVKVEAKVKWIEKVPIIGKRFKVKYEKETKFGQVDNYHGQSQQTVHSNAPHTSSEGFSGEGFTGS